MNRRIAVVAATAAAVLLVSGCTSKTDSTSKETPDVWGYVASAKDAQLEIAESQPAGKELVVSRVLSPEDAWVVVHVDDNGKPGKRVGLRHVSEGESTDVRVTLKNTAASKLIVALHADRGEPDEFDFDMMAPKMKPDRPFFVDEHELAKIVTMD